MSFLISVVRSLSRFQYHNRLLVTTSINLKIKSARCFSVNSTLSHKMYLEYENKYAYDIMRSKGYAMDIEINKRTTALNKESLQEILEEKWSKRQPSEIFEAYTKISSYCLENNLCISNTMFDNFIDDLTDNISKATDSELVSIFYALNMWPETKSIRTRNFIEVWAALDDACLERVNKWSPPEILTFIALFYMLNVSKVSDFCRKGLIKLADKAKRLTPEQLVQTMFFVGIQRQSPKDVHNLEVHFSNTFSNYSLDELAIMSMGFFKSKTPIRSMELIKNIFVKIMDNPKDIHEVSLAALLKIIRYSLKLPACDGSDMVYKLLDVLQHEVPRLSIMCNVHIALLGMSKLVFHKDCLDAVAEHTLKKLSDARLKDLERLILTFGTLNYVPQKQGDFIGAVIEELRKPERHKEILTHGRAFACCISYLGLLDKFPADLINQVLSKDFLNNAYGKTAFTYGKEILVLNNIAEIFCKKENINFLPEREIKMLAKKYTDYMPRADYKKQYNATEKMILDIVKILEETRGGSEFVTGDHILPHHQRGDVILCNGPEGKPLPIPKETFSNFGTIRTPPDDNKWIVLVINGRNGTINGTEDPTGPFKVKLRELRTLGYHSNLLVIKLNDWKSIDGGGTGLLFVGLFEGGLYSAVDVLCTNDEIISLVQWDVYSNLKSAAEKSEYLNKLINQAVKCV